MKKRLVLVLFGLVSVIASSQNKKQHIIELLSNKTETSENVDFYISEVIDNRIYKDNIGIAQKGIFNKKVLSNFKNPFQDEILNYIHTIFPVDSLKKPLILRINQLLISEKTGAFKETGKAIISLDILTKKDNDTYYLEGSFSAYREKNSADVTGKHNDRIRAVLKDCLMQFERSLIYGEKPEPRVISLSTSLKPAILNEQVKEGFFTTFLELYNNTPFVDSLIKFKANRNRPDKLFLEERSHKRALYYAFSNGKSVYINASNYSGEKHFVKTERVKDFLLFNDTFVHTEQASEMSLAFGVLGLMASNSNSHVMLDIYSGQFHIIDANKMKVLLIKDYPKLYEDYNKDRNNIKLMKDILEQVFINEDSEKLRTIFKF